MDVVLEDPYALPFQDGAFSVVASLHAFEHTDFFWLTFLELARVCAAGGYIFLAAPAQVGYHAMPADNWRFQAGAPAALERWARHSGHGEREGARS